MLPWTIGIKSLASEGRMRSVVLLITELAVFLHLTEVTPGLSCTFTQLPPSAVTKTSQANRKSGTDIESCLKFCFESSNCADVTFYS
ncbi:hypothetical protein OSTOST_10479, partial [Ostertagia ostertagi]